MTKREYRHHKLKSLRRYCKPFHVTLSDTIKTDLFFYGIAGTTCVLDEKGEVRVRKLTYDECLSYELNEDEKATIVRP